MKKNNLNRLNNRIARTRERIILSAYVYLAEEIEKELLKSNDIDNIRKVVERIIKGKFKNKLQLSLFNLVELTIKDFVKYFNEVLKRNINLDELHVIESKIMKKFAKKYIADSVVNITATTEKVLNTRITKYMSEGLNFNDIVKNIVKDTKGEIGKHRATIIARTETSKISAITNFETAKGAGFKYKTWLYTNGSVTPRSFHQKMNGKKIKIDELFEVPGEGKVPAVLMRFPKDPEVYIAGQIISCSCQIIYTN